MLSAPVFEALQEGLWTRASLLNHRLLLARGQAAVDDAMRRPQSSGFYDHEFCPETATPVAEEHDLVAAELKAVCRALDLLQRGAYGRCDACGDAVEEQRLMRRPHLLCCSACEQALRAQRLATSRPTSKPAAAAIPAVR
jgi:hypothetical protein